MSALYVERVCQDYFQNRLCQPVLELNLIFLLDENRGLLTGLYVHLVGVDLRQYQAERTENHSPASEFR